MDSQLLAFTLAALVVTISPGPDTFLVIGNTVKGGARHGLATVAGIVSGGLCHAALFGFGIAQVLAYSPTVFTVVKLCGAAYLVYLGMGALRSAFRQRAPVPGTIRSPPGGNASASPVRWRSAWVQGALSNALNPKVAVFYLAFLPQFMSPGDPIAAKSMFLIGIHCVLGLLWLSAVVLAFARLGAWLHRGAVRRVLDGVVGTVMTAFGAKLAVDRG
ncbi:MAG TPA: LysE family translocator [Steroidobacteraceae bacterium]|nr:LysE family translocator [Steroidobacteraceae bacterium]